MKDSEKIGGIVILTLTLLYGYYNISLFSWVGNINLYVLLIGIFALPFFHKLRVLLLIPLIILAIYFSYSLRLQLIPILKNPNYFTNVSPIRQFNETSFLLFAGVGTLLCVCTFLYYLVKKIWVLLPAIALVISFAVNIGANYLYFTSWYWNLFTEDQIREVGLTTMYARANIRIAILYHSIFLLLLLFIKPNYKEKKEPQVSSPE